MPGRLLPFVVLLVLALPAPRAVADPVATASVVGGKDADLADWPSIAFLLAAWDENGDGKLDRAAGCTGTVIASQWILSAAHCAFRPDDRRVDAMLAVTGSADINDEEAEEIAADDVAVHPAWDPQTITGDALLVHLESASARPAMPLARTGGKFHVEDAVTNLAGWGTTDEDNTISTDILQDAHVSILDDATCAQFDGYDPATQTCAGEYQAAGACHGDSGGPLTVLDAAGTPHLWGLTSYGPVRPASYKECDLRIPVIFTRVPAYAGWIDATLAGRLWPPPREDPGPGPGSGPAPGPSEPPADTKPPVLSAVKLSTRRIEPAKRGATIARKAGAILSFTLDEPAAVTVGVRKGRRQRGRVATFAADAGHATKRFSARVGGRKLQRGRYRLRVSAVDVAGNAAPSRRIGFKVV